MLGDSIIDEITYRLLCGERGGELRFPLQQRGQIRLISRAVEHIHRNLDKPVSVDELAKMVHMSRPTFDENFRAVMHIPPLQYAKSVRLDRAQTLIKEGKKASGAGYPVGYNSLSQFSREYKRQIGFSPSATRVISHEQGLVQKRRRSRGQYVWRTKAREEAQHDRYPARLDVESKKPYTLHFTKRRASCPAVRRA